MAQLIVIFFFAGLLVALALFLQHMVRDHWRDIAAALAGRPLPRNQVRVPVRCEVTVPRSRRPRHAAA
ncbi:MAG: hypothetical protein M3N07_04675 [Pseudomonadota bacterium]|nr:hypothetical protein [Pseudomonadota bacterium]